MVTVAPTSSALRRSCCCSSHSHSLTGAWCCHEKCILHSYYYFRLHSLLRLRVHAGDRTTTPLMLLCRTPCRLTSLSKRTRDATLDALWNLVNKTCADDVATDATPVGIADDATSLLVDLHESEGANEYKSLIVANATTILSLVQSTLDTQAPTSLTLDILRLLVVSAISSTLTNGVLAVCHHTSRMRRRLIACVRNYCTFVPPRRWRRRRNGAPRASHCRQK